MAKKHRPKAAAPDPPPPAAPAEIAAESAPEHVEGGLTIGRPTALGITVARWEERLAVFLAVFFLFVFLTQDYGGHLNRGSWNDQSRFATIQALVEQGTFAIDNTRWGWWTGDKVFAGEHFYSTKPPLLSVLGAAVYWPLHRMLGLSYFNDAQAPTIYYVVTLTLIGVPMALAAALFYDLLARFGLALRWRLVGVLGFALGSLYLPYSTIFQNHTVAGIAGLGSFAGLLIASQGPGRFWPLALAGLGVALALATDIVGGAPYAFAAITWLAWRHTAGGRPAAELGPFALGLAVPLTIHFACNYAITGDFSPIYAKAETYRLTNVKGLYGEVLERRGYFATLLDPFRWRYIVNTLFGIRGIFLYTPTLLLGLWAGWRLLGSRWQGLAGLEDGRQWPAMAWWTRGFLAMTLISWLYLLLRTENYGGTSYGSRYFIAPMAVLLLFAALVYRDTVGTPRARGWYAEALRLAIVMSLLGAAFPWGVMDISGTPTNFSFVANLKAYSQNVLTVLLTRAGLGVEA